MVQKVVGSIPISHPIYAGIVQWLVCKFSKLEMRVRFSLPAPFELKAANAAFFVSRSINNRTSARENTTLAAFNFEWWAIGNRQCGIFRAKYYFYGLYIDFFDEVCYNKSIVAV